MTKERFHDLDALRAVAMLLGIALHASLSFTPFPWMVQDTRQNGAFGLFFSALHGFRMPLFFLLSGFFTAMLWRSRGASGLIRHRFRRVFLPCMLGLVTIVPLLLFVSGGAMASGAKKTSKASSLDNDPAAVQTLSSAARSGDLPALQKLLAGGADVNAQDEKLQITPLGSATAIDQLEAARMLIEHGADVNKPVAANGTTPLILAAFFGYPDLADLLIEKGADPTAVNSDGATPMIAAKTDWGVTKYFADLMAIPVTEAKVQEGRAKVIQSLEKVLPKNGSAAQPLPATRGLSGLLGFLMIIPVFHHLWFLWFLCWLAAGFALCVTVARWLKLPGLPRQLLTPGISLLWLVPLTCIPQWFMGTKPASFGPDTSLGIIPIPQVLGYYAVFFGYGAFLFQSGVETRIGRCWWAILPAALLIVFPLALANSFGRPVYVLLQVAYAWMMTFALIGLFRQFLSKESRAVRYMSDSSYWLYIAHVPLVIALQWWVRDWPWPVLAKFIFVCLLTTGFLLLTYQYLVRYTWIGKLLNGTRTRPVRQAAAPHALPAATP